MFGGLGCQLLKDMELIARRKPLSLGEVEPKPKYVLVFESRDVPSTGAPL